MSDIRRKAPFLVAASGFLLLAVACPLIASPIVVPGGNASVDGNYSSNFPFNIGPTSPTTMRFQQVYLASEFASLGGPALITSIAFRPDAVVGAAFTSAIPNIQINLSTTSASPLAGLSATFASNVGADDTTVHSGVLALSSSDVAGPGNTRAFDIVISLQTPFLYDYTKGNLLLDVRNFSDSTTTPFDAHGAATPDSIYSAYSAVTGGVNDLTGSRDTGGLVTQFNANVLPVPEPSSLLLLAAGLGGLCSRRRR